MKIKIGPNSHQYAIQCSCRYGPSFGFDDIIIFSNANTNANSYSNLGLVFKHPQYPQYAFETSEAKSFFAGSEYFQLSEIEVYQKE